MDDRDLTDPDRADLAALADGTLPAERRASVEERAAASPVLRAALAQQQAALAAVRAGDHDIAPEALHEWVAAQPAAPVDDGRRARRSFRVGLAGVAIAAAAVLALIFLPSYSSPLEDVADAAAQAPASGPPARAATGTLDVSSDGLAFPDWQKRGWRAIGVRTDTVDGREATTVTYERPDGDRFHYAIVPRPLVEDTPDEGYGLTELDGKPAVVWRRGDRTCLLISQRVSHEDLLALARTTRDY